MQAIDTASETETRPVLVADGLSLAVRGASGLTPIVEDISFAIARGECFALIGESGSGKTMIARAIMQLLPKSLLEIKGRLIFQGRDIASADAATMRSLRGRQIGMIFQEPMSSLNPLMMVGRQIDEAMQVHGVLDRRQRRDRVRQLLADVRFDAPDEIRQKYPHELSGGMRQRIMIAMAIANEPALLIADEPTTALDVSIQAEVMEILSRLRRKYHLSVLFISHDLSLVYQHADRIGVLYSGVLMETGPAQALIHHPRHPYPAALISCAPRRGTAGQRLKGIEGMVPSLAAPLPGCRFAPRCSRASDDCRAGRIAATHNADGTMVRCLHPLS
jgi:oligopeptide/dipeptide ABC transporter ATP-binding protein